MRLTAQMQYWNKLLSKALGNPFPDLKKSAHYFKLQDERVQRNLHQLNHNDHVIGLFALEQLQIKISDFSHAQVLAMTYYWL